jgi:hypothetical protein
MILRAKMLCVRAWLRDPGDRFMILVMRHLTKASLTSLGK